MHSAGLSAGHFVNMSFHHPSLMNGIQYDPQHHLLHHQPMFNGTTGDSIELALSVIVLLGGSLSLVGLAFAFITYSLFSDPSDFGGTTLMNLLASLFLGQLLHVIGNGDPSLFDTESSCLTLAFIQHYMWLSKFFWLLALVKDVRHRLTKVQGLNQVSSKKIQRTEVQSDDSGRSSPFSSSRTATGLLLGSYPTSIFRLSLFFWGTPLLLTSVSFLLQQTYYADAITGDTQTCITRQCWLLGPSILLILPVLVLTVLISVGILRTCRLSRGARHLLLTDRQFEHINRCLSFVLKLLPLLLITLSTGVAGKLLLQEQTSSTCPSNSAASSTVWASFHLSYSLNGLLVACLLTCDCQMVRSFANVSSLFRHRHRHGNDFRYGTGEIVSANDLNMLVFCKDDTNVV